MTKDEYVEAIRQAFITMGKQVAMKALLSRLPIFGNFFLNPIAAYFIGIIVEALARAGETAAFFAYIDMRVGAQSKAFEKAAAENFKAQQSGTDQEKKDAADRLKKAFRDFAIIPN